MESDLEILSKRVRRHDDYYPLFDWLRGVLAGIVLLFHQGIITWANAGNLAVQVFFALSGWLIGGMLLQMNRADLPRFYFNRVARIWAPYFVALGLLIGASILRDHVGWKWAEFVFYKSTFVYNLFGPPQLAEHRQEMPLAGAGNHFWSVNVEEQFYLMAPLLLVAVNPKIGRALLTWIIICVLTFLIDFHATIPATSPSIALGVTAAIVVWRFKKLHLGTFSRIGLGCIACATAYGMAIGGSYNFLAPLFAISVVLLLTIKGSQNRCGAIVGGISYPIYLNQWVGSFAAHAMLRPLGMRDSAWFHPLAIGLNIGIAYGLYRLIDQSILTSRSRLFNASRGRMAMLLAYGTLLFGLLGGLCIFFASRKPS